MTTKVKDRIYTIDVSTISSSILTSNFAKSAELTHRDIMLDVTSVVQNSMENFIYEEGTPSIIDSVSNATADFSLEVESYVYGNLIKETLLKSQIFLTEFKSVGNSLISFLNLPREDKLIPYTMTTYKGNRIFIGVSHR